MCQMFKTTANDVENISPPGRNPRATWEPSENARVAAEAHFPGLHEASWAGRTRRHYLRSLQREGALALATNAVARGRSCILTRRTVLPPRRGPCREAGARHSPAVPDGGGEEGRADGTCRNAVPELCVAALPCPSCRPAFSKGGLFRRERGNAAATHMGSNVLLSQDFSASKFSMIILTTIQSGPSPAPPRQQQQHHQRRRRAPCRPAGRDPGSRRASPCPPRPPPGSAEAARQGQEAQRHEGGGTNRAAAAPRGPRSRFSFTGKRGPAAPRLPSSCSSAAAGGHRTQPRNAPPPLAPQPQSEAERTGERTSR